MNRKAYWEWLDRIWKKPEEISIRQAFADWLLEEGYNEAHRKQVACIKILNEAYIVYSRIVSIYPSKNNRGYRLTKKIYCELAQKNKVTKAVYEIKRDGRLIKIDYMHYKANKSHILRGSFYKLKKLANKNKRKISRKARYRTLNIRLTDYWAKLYGRKNDFRPEFAKNAMNELEEELIKSMERKAKSNEPNQDPTTSED